MGLFRKLSFDEIGTSTIQSRALAGIANDTIFSVFQGLQEHARPLGKKSLKTNWISTIGPVILLNLFGPGAIRFGSVAASRGCC